MKKLVAVGVVVILGLPLMLVAVPGIALGMLSNLLGGAGAAATSELVVPISGFYVLSSGYGPRSGGPPGASTWHPAIDLAAACGTPVLAMQSGTVTVSGPLTLTVQSEAGHSISYLHSEPSDRTVKVGDVVLAGQIITLVGSVPPSSGCHLDIRVSRGSTTDVRVSVLEPEPGAGIYVNPELFAAMFGVELCGDSCWKLG